MSNQMDLSCLDRPEILETVFPIVYSPFYQSHNPPFSLSHGKSYSIEVEKGIKIGCGFWASGKEDPSILYFHGNGETAGIYDWIAPLYNQRHMNLFVADYRGYGSSDGKPTVGNMLSDAHCILKGFREILEKEGFKDSIFLMGRSLGSMPAIELALQHQGEIRGLIIESGTANNLRRLWGHLKTAEKDAIWGEDSPFLNKVKIRKVLKPTLIIHGEYDQIVPVDEGKELYQNAGAQDKRVLIIPGADHNDIMGVGQDLYLNTLEEFIKANS